MSAGRLSLLLLFSMMLAGCFFRSSPEEKCARPQEYQESEAVSELRVPPGLDRPEESDSMDIPEADQQGYPEGRPCLEMPPDYFGRPVD